MLEYNEPLYRPPSEGNNLIIQATLGCSHNKCSFCAMYKSKKFTKKPIEEIYNDIKKAAYFYPEVDRVFLADGNAFCLPTDHLANILDYLKANFKNLTRVSSYAAPRDILNKSDEELKILRDKKLSLVYLGVESGSNTLLKKITKGASRKGHIEAINRAMDAKIKISATVILGLGGKKYSEEHAIQTADLINQAPPTYLSTLHLRLYPDTVEQFYRAFGEDIDHLDDDEKMDEMARMIKLINPNKPIIFRSNHASNNLPLAGNLPKDKEKLLETINMAKAGAVRTRPIFMRGL